MTQSTSVLDRFGRELKSGQWVAQPKARSGSASVDVAMVKEVNSKRDVRVVHFWNSSETGSEQNEHYSRSKHQGD